MLRRVAELTMTVIVLASLGPTTMTYVLGIVPWFLLYVALPIIGFIDRLVNRGWSEAIQFVATLLDEPRHIGFSAFMLASGIGLASLWLLYQTASNRQLLKEVHRLNWCGLAIGWVPATLIAMPPYRGALPSDHFLVGANFLHWVFGLGPMLAAVVLFVWLISNSVWPSVRHPL